jgi:hypothetical protein
MDGNNRLPVLAAEIVTAHDGARAAAKASLASAMLAGDRLIEAKAMLGHGEWLPWLAANVPFSERTASRYMRLARHRDQLETCHVADLAIRGASDALAEARPDFRELVDDIEADLNDIHAAERLAEDADAKLGKLGAALLLGEVLEAVGETWEAILRRLGTALRLAATEGEVRTVLMLSDVAVGGTASLRSIVARYRDALSAETAP